MLMNLDICDHPFLYQFLHLALLIRTHQNQTTWLASRASPRSPAVAQITDHSQLIRTPSFIKWDWLLSCFVEWDIASII